MSTTATLPAALELAPESRQLATAPGVSGGLDIAAIQGRVADVNRVIDSLMTVDVHYGQAFPGSDKDSLLQPGAEMLIMAFQMVPHPNTRREPLENGHLRVICDGYLSTADGRALGELMAECSTRENKYRFRFTGLECPECGAEEVRKSKTRPTDPPGAVMGYYCWKKKGVAAGCGATFEHNDDRITGQKPGKVENDNPEDLWHTVTRIAEKRWLVAVARRDFSLSSRFVDEQAAQDAAFDVVELRPILRALPGERAAKWAEVVAFSLQRFSKAPRELTCLEGSVVKRWLGEQVQSGSARLSASDFGESPEANGAPVAPKPPEEKPAAAPAADPSPDKDGQTSPLSTEQARTALDAIKKRKGVTYPKIRTAKGWSFQQIRDVPADTFDELMEAITAGDQPAADDGQLRAVEDLMRTEGTNWDAVREKHPGLPGLPIDLHAAEVDDTLELIAKMKDGTDGD